MKSPMGTTTIAAERLDHQTLEVQLGHLGCHWPLAMQPDLTLVAGARVDLHHTSVGIFGIRPGGICWWGSIQILGSFGVHGKFNRGGGEMIVNPHSFDQDFGIYSIMKHYLVATNHAKH